MKYKLIIASLGLLLSTSSYADQVREHRAHHISAGYSQLYISDGLMGDMDVPGLNLSYLYLPNKSEWGMGATIDYNKQDDSAGKLNVKDEAYNISLAVVYQPDTARWFRLYPTVGYSSYELETSSAVTATTSDTYNGFSLGAGVQLAIPRTWMHLDISAKHVFMTDDLFDKSSMNIISVGLGYRF